MRRFQLAALLLASPAAAGLFGGAPAPTAARLDILDSGFSPRTLILPSGRKVRITVANKTSRAAEFESFSLHREQIVAPGGEIPVFVGPLKAGRYDFFDDFSRGRTGEIVASTATAAGKP